MDLTLYKKVLGSNSVAQGYIKDTILHVNDSFSKSPSFRQVEINGEMIDAIVSQVKKSTEIEFLFRPQTKFDKGVYVSIGQDIYLIKDFLPNEIYPKAKAELCNSSLKWRSSAGDLLEYKCVVKSSSFGERTERQAFILHSELIVLVQYNDDTKTIKPTQRFIFGGHVYEVTTIDSVTDVYNDKGIVELIVKFASSSSTDDIDNQIPDDSGNSGWGEW
jgi:hypothetical protein